MFMFAPERITGFSCVTIPSVFWIIQDSMLLLLLMLPFIWITFSPYRLHKRSRSWTELPGPLCSNSDRPTAEQLWGNSSQFCEGSGFATWVQPITCMFSRMTASKGSPLVTRWNKIPSKSILNPCGNPHPALECCGMTQLWKGETCLAQKKRRLVAALQISRMRLVVGWLVGENDLRCGKPHPRFG